MIFKGSRYSTTSVIPADTGAGTPRHLALRSADPVPGALIYTVAEGERLDQLSYRFYSDPSKYWLILDANPEILNPFELLKVGQQIRIPRNRV